MIPRTKVFVGSLPPGSKPEELRRLFENYGVVTECDIMNRCGFVHMETQEMAENAIRALNNTNFKGATISVEHGRMKDRGGRGGGRMGGGAGVGNSGGMRRGGGGPRSNGLPRGGPAGNFSNQGGGGMRGNRGVGGNVGRSNSGSGPMRRDRGFNQRNPYNRNGTIGSGPGGLGGGVGMGGGPKGGRNFDDGGYNHMPQGGMGGLGNMGPSDRFNSSNYGMGNQDRRGFALPESRNMYGNDMGGQKRGPVMGGGGSSGGFGGGSQGFDRRHGGNFNNSGRDNFSRRGGSGGGGNMNSDGMGGNRGFPRGGSNLGNAPISGGIGGGYNQQFPPLGGGNNRNGPRRDMPNRRY